MGRPLAGLSLLALGALAALGSLSCSRGTQALPGPEPRGSATSAAIAPAPSASAPLSVATASASAAPPAAPGALADAYQGTIGNDLAVFLRISRDATGAVRGSYFYAGKGIDIGLRGTLSPAGDFKVDETVAGGKHTGAFAGTLGPSGELTGTWSDPAGKTLPFQLTPIPRRAGAPAIIARKQFHARYHVDKYDGTDPPWDVVDLAAPEIFGLGSAAAEAKINEKLAAEVKDDRGPPPVEHSVGHYKGDYTITLNRGGVLSLTFDQRGNCAQCAHEVINGKTLTFSLATGEDVPFDKLFRPGGKAKLRAMGEADYRKKAGPEFDEYSLEMAFEGDYSLSDKGLRLIAFYRLPFVSKAFDPQLEFPFPAIEPLLDPKSPAAGAWKSP